MPKREELEARVAQLESDREALFRKRKPIDDALSANYYQLEKAQEQLGKLLVAEMAAPDWPTLLLAEGRGGQAMYKHASSTFYEMGFYKSGYYPETGQVALKIMITHGKPETIARTREGIATLAPHIIPHKDGMIRFEIFEHTLCQFGVHSLLVAPDLSSATVTSTSRYKSSPAFSGSLDDALKYIHDNHWYDGRDSDEEYD